MPRPDRPLARPLASPRLTGGAAGVGAAVVVMLAAGCGPDREVLRAELEAASAASRDAHLAGDAEALAETWADTLVSVSDGEVRRAARQEIVPGFQAYFDATRFLEWDDVAPPVVSVSGEGDAGRVTVRKRVRTVTLDPAGFPRYGHDVFAWLESWRRADGRWAMEAIASSDRPGRETELVDLDRPFDDTPPELPPSQALDERMVGGAILSAARQALGGAEAVRAVEGFLAVAAGRGPDRDYVLETFAARDGRARLRQSFPGGDSTVLLRRADGSFAAPGPEGGLQPADSTVATFLLGHQFHMLALAPDALAGSAHDRRAGAFEGRPAIFLGYRDPAGARIEIAHAERGGLPLGGRIRPRGGEEEIVFVFGEWRQAGGLRLPGAVRVRQGGEDYLLRYSALVPNPAPGEARPD